MRRPGTKVPRDHVGQKLNFTTHVRLVCKKANKAVQNLSRILPNVSAATQAKRSPMSNVVHSMLLYGVLVWVNTMSKKGMSDLAKVQTRIAIRVATAYRTTSKRRQGLLLP